MEQRPAQILRQRRFGFCRIVNFYCNSFDKRAFSEAQLSNGNLCFLLNGSTSSDQSAFRQTLGEDLYPVLDPSHKVVYTNGNSFSNTEGGDDLTPDANGIYHIQTKEHLVAFSELVQQDGSASAVLDNDIDLQGNCLVNSWFNW